MRHERPVDPRAHHRLGLGELLAIVDPGDVAKVGLDGGDADPLGGARDDVGQVVLPLRVARRQPGGRLAEKIDRAAVDAGVHLGDGALLRRGVLLLDDADHVAPLVAQDPAVAGRIGRRRRHHRQAAVAARGPHQRRQRLAPEERHVAVEHQDQLTGEPLQGRHRQLDRVAGAALLGLLDDGHRVGPEPRAQRRLDGRPLVTEHGDHRIGAERPRQLDRIGAERAAENLVQHLGARGAHPRPLPRREHDRRQPAADRASTLGILFRARRHGLGLGSSTVLNNDPSPCPSGPAG